MYERTVAFQLWIKSKDNTVQRVALQRIMTLPLTGKRYKVTLKNIKIYVQELMEQDSDIIEVQIDRVASVGLIRRKGESNGILD
jgi:hypothetical protein